MQNERNWKETNATWKEHERNVKGNKCNMKAEWKEQERKQMQHESKMKGTWKETNAK